MAYLQPPGTIQLNGFAWFFLVVLMVLVPFSAWRSQSRLHRAPTTPSRRRIYAAGLYTQATFAISSALIVVEVHLRLFPAYSARVSDLVWGLTLLTLGLLPLWRDGSTDGVARRRTLLMAPRSMGDHVAFYALCVVTAFTEELTFRGALFSLLASLSHGWWASALLAALPFAAVHSFQGWRSASLTFLYALRDQVLVGLTGTLVVAMVVHALHDVIAGTVLGARAKRSTFVAVAVGSAGSLDKPFTPT
jgi:membrane protease YdiL (CAAX protease family)